MKNKASVMSALTAGMLAMGGDSMMGLQRMPQKDFENAVRVNAKAKIANDRRKAEERAASPKEKKRKKQVKPFSNNYVGMPKKERKQNLK